MEGANPPAAAFSAQSRLSLASYSPPHACTEAPRRAVEPDQVWRATDGQHYKVVSVHAGIATLQRCTPAGRVLNQRYKTTEAVERMQADFKLVGGGG